jgi:hypothetical protein
VDRPGEDAGSPSLTRTGLLNHRQTSCQPRKPAQPPTWATAAGPASHMGHCSRPSLPHGPLQPARPRHTFSAASGSPAKFGATQSWFERRMRARRARLRAVRVVAPRSVTPNRIPGPLYLALSTRPSPRRAAAREHPPRRGRAGQLSEQAGAASGGQDGDRTGTSCPHQVT